MVSESGTTGFQDLVRRLGLAEVGLDFDGAGTVVQSLDFRNKLLGPCLALGGGVVDDDLYHLVRNRITNSTSCRKNSP